RRRLQARTRPRQRGRGNDPGKMTDTRRRAPEGRRMAKLSPLLKQATPVLAARGEGVYLYDTDGRRHLDFTAGIGVTGTGHCHPRVVEAAQRQVGTLIHGQYTT